MKHADLVGTWELVKFELEDLKGVRTPWGRGTHGMLLYTADGRMSVAVNRELERSGQGEMQDIFDATLFYAGTFEIQGSDIIHEVQNASNPARIGKRLIRHAKLQGDQLELSSPPESFGRGMIVWKRRTSGF